MRRAVPLACVILAGCSLSTEPEDRSYPWFSDGAVLSFDFVPVADTFPVPGEEDARYEETPDALVLTVLRVVAAAPGVFHEFNWGGGAFQGLSPEVTPFELPPTPYLTARADGLYTAYCVDGGTFWCNRSAYRIYLPAEPVVGRVTPRGTISAVGREVATRAGVFPTYVIHGDYHGFPRREYWSERHGLIRVDLLRDDDELSGYYALGEKSY